MGDADIMDGYVPSTEEQRLELAWMQFGRELVEVLGLTEDEAAWLKEEAFRLGLSTDQVMDYVWEHYKKAFENATAGHPMYGLPFLYKVYEIHQGSVEEANAYIRERLKKPVGGNWSLYHAVAGNDIQDWSGVAGDFSIFAYGTQSLNEFGREWGWLAGKAVGLLAAVVMIALNPFVLKKKG